MAVDKKMRLGEMLIKAGVIHEFQLNSALSFQRQLGGRLGASLIRLGYLDEEKLLQFIAEQFSLTRVDLEAQTISPDILQLVPVDKALEFSVIPFAIKVVKGSERLFVATTDPTNIAAMDEVKFISGLQVQPAIASEDSIIAAIKRCYNIGPKTKGAKALASVTPIRKQGADPAKFLSTEEKLKVLVKLLVEKKILSKEDLQRFKG